MSDTQTPQLKGDSLVAEIAAATLRHSLSGLSGILVAAGAITHSQQGEFVSIGMGVGMWVVGLGWSYVQKWAKSRGVA